MLDLDHMWRKIEWEVLYRSSASGDPSGGLAGADA
jgi:hypothetical protein